MSTACVSRIVSVVCFSLAVSAGMADTNQMINVPSLRTALSSDAPDVRREAVESILAGKAEDKYVLINADVVALLAQAATDRDASVRKAAMRVVHAVAEYAAAMSQLGTNSAEYKWAQQVSGGAAPVDIASDTRMKGALLSTLDDEDPEIRRLSVMSLVRAYPPSPDLENALATRFEHEPIDGVRNTIIRGFGVHGYSSVRTMSLLSNARTHAKSDTERAMLDDVIKKLSSEGRDLPPQ